ncbi:hypothetical protein [Streptomyces griseorubiginosus]|uniref:hypothetical protein n=1 Tax=Streptomyces griseorubiginosus TaxID=67304 RepID=UPI0034524BDD
MLAQWLEQLRQQCGLTYRQMALMLQQSSADGLIRYSCSQLARVVDHPDPQWPLVHAFTVACNGDVKRAQVLWADAAHAASGTSRTSGMRPESINHHHELLKEMRRIRIQAGNPSLDQLRSRARKAGQKLPKSTLGAMLKGQRLPGSKAFKAFLAACGEPEGALRAWEEALERCREEQRKLRAQARRAKTMALLLASPA